MPNLSLEELNRQIAQREQELEALRQELESRRNQFTSLTQRKEELLNQLRQVESEIAALTAATSVPRPGAPVRDRPTMPQMIVSVLRETGRAMTPKQLSEELRRRGFPLAGRKPAKSVETRLREMALKHVVQRAIGQPGYVLVPSTQGPKADKSKAAPNLKDGKKAAPQTVKPHPKAKPAQPGQQQKQLTLREALTNVLKNHSHKYLSGDELAKLVRSSGYKTKSSKFVKAVWAMLGKLDNVEHVRGKGYRLKKA